MISFISFGKAQEKIAESVRERRLAMELTQEGLAKRSGVALSTLRKFEQKGTISLDSLIKILLIIGGLEEVIQALKLAEPKFLSIEEVIKDTKTPKRKRGRKV